jgi:hypothetical protein
MAFYRPQDTGLIEPRDPSAIDERSQYGSDRSNALSLVILLLIVAVAFGLYFLYADSSATLPNAAPPPAAQVSPSPAPAPSPATQPPTQTPTP